METGKALEIVHAMAQLLYKDHGEFTVACNPSEAQEALDTIEDLIVNNFGVDDVAVNKDHVSEPTQSDDAHYSVRWDIDVWARNPREAALKARYAQVRSDSIAKVFDCRANSGPLNGQTVRIDLCEADQGQQDVDPVHKDDNGWYFWDETWADKFGPYPTEELARETLAHYMEILKSQEQESKPQ